MKHTPTHTHTLLADINEVPTYGGQKVCRGVKEEAEQKQISNEIITIPRESDGEIEGEKEREREQGCHNSEEQSCRVNGKGEVGGRGLSGQ